MLHIKNPFYSAGRLYNWEGSPVGIGINLKALEGDGKIRIMVGSSNKIWEIDKYQALAFIKEHNSYYEARGTKLGVIAWSQFKPLSPEEESLEMVKKGLI